MKWFFHSAAKSNKFEQEKNKQPSVNSHNNPRNHKILQDVGQTVSDRTELYIFQDLEECHTTVIEQSGSGKVQNKTAIWYSAAQSPISCTGVPGLKSWVYTPSFLLLWPWETAQVPRGWGSVRQTWSKFQVPSTGPATLTLLWAIGGWTGEDP